MHVSARKDRNLAACYHNGKGVTPVDDKVKSDAGQGNGDNGGNPLAIYYGSLIA